MTSAGSRDLQSNLPPIPLIEAPGGPLQLAGMMIDAVPRLTGIAAEILPAPLISLTDALSERWLRRSSSPYKAEIGQVARQVGVKGVYLLNLNYEWACTTGCHPQRDGEAMTLYRTLDWPLRLGAETVVARHETPHGPYLNATWPGFAGVLTGIAKGRFAAAINQAPMAYSLGRLGLGVAVDWLFNRCRLGFRQALPPSHLLRQAFETCASYQEAVEMLQTTPICAPALFSLAGTRPAEACIIERRETDGVLHEGPGAIANHWLTGRFHGRPRPIRSHDRREAMLALMPRSSGNLDWLQPPILNRFTRLACEMNATTGQLVIQGWHGPAAQTQMMNYS